jgi:hypothetical protein
LKIGVAKKKSNNWRFPTRSAEMIIILGAALYSIEQFFFVLLARQSIE